MTPACEISVIVPVRNGASVIAALLESLARQTLSADRYEVIVVDNDSSDSTAEIARFHGARVVREPIANRSRARNLGASVATSRLYAFVDADCVAHPQWLEALLANAGLAPLVAGDVRTRISDDPNVVERFESLWRFGQEWWVRDGWAATANLLVHADAFETIGGFDSGWHHIGEDVDLCLRARDAGYGLAYCREAIVEHDGEDSFGPFLRRCYRHGYSVNQCYYRLGIGYRAWQHPLPAVAGDRALRDIGHRPEQFSAHEWRVMARMARLGYGARIVGSICSEAMRAR